MQVAELHADEVGADAFAGARGLFLAPVHLDPPHPDRAARGKKLELLVPVNSSRDEAPRHDRSEARNEERAVDRKPDRARLALLATGSRGEARQSRPQPARSPSPVVAETGRIGASSRKEPATSSRTSEI